MEKLVSAIITTHNRLDLLKRAVDSVLSQSYKNIELIIVDDASQDGTEEWCTELQVDSLTGKSLRNISYIRIMPGKSKGGNYARNLGIKKSKGEYIAFLDDDDMWLPDKTANQLQAFSNPAVGVVYGKRISEIVSADGSVSLIEQRLKDDYKGDISKKVLTRMFTTTSLIMIKRSMLDKAGLFDEDLKFWQDYEFLIRLAQVTEFDYVDSPVTIYRVNKNDSKRLTNKYYGWKNAVNYIHSKHEKLYNSLNYSDRLKVRILTYADAYLRCKSGNLKYKGVWFRCVQILLRIYVNILDRNLLKNTKYRII